MKNQILSSTLNKLILFLFIISVALFAGCSDDPQATNEEEVITTITVTIVRDAKLRVAGDTVILSWDDTNLDAIVDASEIVTNGFLKANEKYEADIQIGNKSVNPEIDIDKEILKEAEEHIICFTVTNVGISISNQNEDKHGLPVGLTSTWSTTSAEGTGTVIITLRHQPGVKTGDCPGAGETDATITFPLRVEFVIE